jgi:hypothetical protein
MKRFALVMLLLFAIIISGLTQEAESLWSQVSEFRGHQWERLDAMEKELIVSGVLGGFSMVRDFAFDLDPKIYERYEAYDEFLAQGQVVSEIVENLDRYYELNRDNYKYDDRVTNMIIVIYSKYWWR